MENIPYNPWYSYNTVATLNNAAYIRSGTYDKDSKQILTIPVEIYQKQVLSEYIEIGTDKNDKFLSLVDESILNSNVLNGMFE
jgi:hypothetical protein